MKVQPDTNPFSACENFPKPLKAFIILRIFYSVDSWRHKFMQNHCSKCQLLLVPRYLSSTFLAPEHLMGTSVLSGYLIGTSVLSGSLIGTSVLSWYLSTSLVPTGYRLIFSVPVRQIRYPGAVLTPLRGILRTSLVSVEASFTKSLKPAKSSTAARRQQKF